MKKSFLVALAMVFTMGLFAQQQGQRREFKPEDQATRQADQVKKACDLNETQYKSVYTLYLNQAKEMQKLRETAKEGERPQFNREDMQKRRDAFNAEMKKVLTEEQYAKYEKMPRGQRGQGQGQGQGQRGGQDGQRPQRNAQ